MAEKIIRENAFEHKKKKPGLISPRVNRPSNNWALVFGRLADSFFQLTLVKLNCVGHPTSRSFFHRVQKQQLRNRVEENRSLTLQSQKQAAMG